MPYRKLIQFGGNSFVISLPKKWVNDNNLMKGDSLHIEMLGNNIVISPTKTNNTEEEYVITINIDGTTTFKNIRRRLYSAYVNGATTIIINGNDIGKFSKMIDKLLGNYVALELVEQTSKKIIIKTYINITDVVIESFIRRIDNTIRSMAIDVIDCVEKEQFEIYNDVIESVFQRDVNIEKIKRFLFRVIKARMINQGLRNNEGEGALLRYWDTISLLNKISHQVEAIGVFALKRTEVVTFSTDKSKFDLFRKIYNLYIKSMTAFYKVDEKRADEATDQLNELQLIISRDEKLIHTTVKHMLINLLGYAHDLNRLSY